MATIDLVRREWAAVRRPGRLIALAAASLAVIALGLLASASLSVDCPGQCPPTPRHRRR